MPLRTKLAVFAVVLLLLFAGLSVGSYLSLSTASAEAEAAREELDKLYLVETLEATCSTLSSDPDLLTCERARRALLALRDKEWQEGSRPLLDRVLKLSEPLIADRPVPDHEEVKAAVSSLKSEILRQVHEDIRGAEGPTHERATRLLVASCLLAMGGAATFAWLANRLVRERNALEERVRRSEKLAALATLAAGIAHEINNPLATISMSAEAMAERLPADSDEVVYCEAIQTEAERCRDIIGDLSDLARGGALDREPVDPRELTNAAVSIVRRNASLPSASVEPGIPNDLPFISADRGKLLQVLVNLLQNGIEAAGPEGEVRLSAERRDGSLFITVSDDGKGIPPRLIDRIFEPFYTDKPSGVGLGLTLCYRIAEMHGGELRVASPGVGQGSTFTLVLPIEARNGP